MKKQSFFAKAVSHILNILIAGLIGAVAYIVIILLGVDLSFLSRYDKLIITVVFMLAGAILHGLVNKEKIIKK